MFLPAHGILQGAFGVPAVLRGEIFRPHRLGGPEHSQRELPVEDPALPRELGALQASVSASVQLGGASSSNLLSALYERGESVTYQR